MSKLVFVSDFFAEHVQGGAEIYDSILIQELISKGVKVCKFQALEFTNKHFELYEKMGFNFVISNFTHLDENLKKVFQLYPDRYSILEHDHKYISNRNPAVFVDFKPPSNMIINRDFYKNAKNVFCQSVKHAEVLRNNLKIDNVINLGCSLWSSEQLSLIRQQVIKKNNKAIIINDPNPIKGTQTAVDVCKKKNIDFDLVEKTSHEEYLTNLSRYDKLAFFPKTLESFCRVIVEARMLECKLITNNLNGCTYEPWFSKLKGHELIDYVDEQRNVVVNSIFDAIFSHSEESIEGDITAILNCYRRPYNLKMQVDSLKNQTIKPKQIWLWINHHEDNIDFDPKTLGVDRIFHNDYNWKFYGRFAAALLSDTEYIAIYDDDTIPGKEWHQNCLETMKTNEGIMGSAGYVQTGDKAMQYYRHGWPSQNKNTERVDYVGHAWFFKREWLPDLWREMPPTWDNGEDMHLSYTCQKYSNIQTYCPPHPPEEKEKHGSLLGYELGVDSKATSNNADVSHTQFFSERDMCVRTALNGGWDTVNKIK